ncbi:MAG TPA: hypothetical protein VFV43_00490, partial [Limnobacter sp.]|nr:hypothetical protein [Limnobacter sp.]
EVVNAGEKVFSVADKHGQRVSDILSMPDFGSRPSDAVRLGYELNMMTGMWQLASSLMKDLTEPLKSIVNK